MGLRKGGWRRGSMHAPHMHLKNVLRGACGVAYWAQSRLQKKVCKLYKDDKLCRVQYAVCRVHERGAVHSAVSALLEDSART